MGRIGSTIEHRHPECTSCGFGEEGMSILTSQGRIGLGSFRGPTTQPVLKSIVSFELAEEGVGDNFYWL